MNALPLASIGSGSPAGSQLISIAESTGARVRRYKDGFDFLSCKEAFTFRIYMLDGLEGAIDFSDILDVLVRRNKQAIVFYLKGGAELSAACLSQIHPFYLTIPGGNAVGYVLGIGRVAEEDAGDWLLLEHPYRLVSPKGTHLCLSENDYLLLKVFLDACGTIRSCEDIAHGLARETASVGVSEIYRRVFRLRRRVVSKLKLPLPLLTIHGSGYLFNGRLVATLDGG
jgi:hypothetical protein